MINPKKSYRNFLRNEDGNIAIMAAGAAMPMLALIMGGIEMAEFSRIERSMQHAADTAVMAAFDGRDSNWSQRIKRADRFFDMNFPYDHRIKKVERKLSGSQRRRKITLEYSASAQNVNLTGKFNPFAKSRVSVKARAVYVQGSNRAPRLVYSRSSSEN